ncbi:amidohydrolase [Sporosalibacterium faouarense]|uniref:amidohydrolase n=1 Tax=Sporosalibacterium faouarense TaxID=516123 RepID=UPI00192C2F59|nr:amidohydrolase [Sporosalibacterium faouarense]
MSKKFLYNGSILTMDDKKREVESVLIENSKIVFCGDYEKGLNLIDENTEKIDLNGRTLLPGFNDSHLHLFNYSLSQYKVNLFDMISITDIKNELKSFRENEELKVFGDWIVGFGWNHIYFEDKKLPSKEDIDGIIDDRPVFLSRACGHICLVNSKALELAGIDKDTEDPKGGRIDRDPNTGEPTGILRENALYLVYDKIPMLEDINKVKELIYIGIKKANEVGLTSIQTDDFSHVKFYTQIIDAYKLLKEEGNLNARINLQMLLKDTDKLKEFLKLDIKTGDGDANLRFGPLKILADGSLGSRTAALEEPYSDDESTYGVLIYKDEEIYEVLKMAHTNGLQLAVHAIGDRCMNQILDIYAKLTKEYPKEDPRYRIIHAQIASSEIFNRFKTLDVIADVQPIFMKTDMYMAEERVGNDRLKTSYAWKTMMDKGIHLSGSSDCPIEPFDPILGIYSVVTRKDLKENPKGGWNSNECLDIYDALKLYTTNSAYSTYEENIKGKIEEGMLADLVILSDDIMKIEEESIKDIRVDMTMLGGKVVFER